MFATGISSMQDISRSQITQTRPQGIENRSRKRSHKLDGIGVGRIRTFPFLRIPFTTPSLMIQ